MARSQVPGEWRPERAISQPAWNDEAELLPGRDRGPDDPASRVAPDNATQALLVVEHAGQLAAIMVAVVAACGPIRRALRSASKRSRRGLRGPAAWFTPPTLGYDHRHAPTNLGVPTRPWDLLRVNGQTRSTLLVRERSWSAR